MLPSSSPVRLSPTPPPPRCLRYGATCDPTTNPCCPEWGIGYAPSECDIKGPAGGNTGADPAHDLVCQTSNHCGVTRDPCWEAFWESQQDGAGAICPSNCTLFKVRNNNAPPSWLLGVLAVALLGAHAPALPHLPRCCLPTSAPPHPPPRSCPLEWTRSCWASTARCRSVTLLQTYPCCTPLARLCAARAILQSCGSSVGSQHSRLQTGACWFGSG